MSSMVGGCSHVHMWTPPPTQCVMSRGGGVICAMWTPPHQPNLLNGGGCSSAGVVSMCNVNTTLLDHYTMCDVKVGLGGVVFCMCTCDTMTPLDHYTIELNWVMVKWGGVYIAHVNTLHLTITDIELNWVMVQGGVCSHVHMWHHPPHNWHVHIEQMSNWWGGGVYVHCETPPTWHYTIELNWVMVKWEGVSMCTCADTTPPPTHITSVCSTSRSGGCSHVHM